MIGETTNLHRLNLGYDFKPCPRWQVLADYHLLWANQDGQTDAGGTSPFYFSDTGNFRGQLFTLWLKWSCCKRVRAHYLVEYFIPGNYYDQSNRSAAWFLRANLEYTF